MLHPKPQLEMLHDTHRSRGHGKDEPGPMLSIVSHSDLSRVCGLGFRIMVRGLGFRVEVQGLGIRVRGKELGA